MHCAPIQGRMWFTPDEGVDGVSVRTALGVIMSLIFIRVHMDTVCGGGMGVYCRNRLVRPVCFPIEVSNGCSYDQSGWESLG
jgi:hypothetical protein